MMGRMAAACFFVVLTTTPAQAYLDPGTGSYLIQLMVASLVSVIYVIRTYWQAITTWIRGRSNPGDASSDPGDTAP